MNFTKECLTCGTTFEKPLYCSVNEWNHKRKFCSKRCAYDYPHKKPSPFKGKQSSKPSVKQFVPCRICGEPTKYPGSPKSKLIGKVRCEKPSCIEASKELKNKNISEKAIEMYASGERVPSTDGWSNVQRVSTEEKLISPWLESLGFTPQYKFLTGVHTNKLPRMFRLDFALLQHKLYIEIDGSVHRLRKERDARRDSMMKERGWIGLRIQSNSINSDMESVKNHILSWVRKHIANKM